MRSDILIIGAGHGGAQAAAALRDCDFDGSIRVIGDEPELPYERPPLSKDYLSGKRPFERMLLRGQVFWDERGIELTLGRRVVSVVPGRHEVTCDDGSTIGYGKLVWAAGGAARRLSCRGHDLAGVHTLRNRADVDRMSAGLDGAANVVVIGGGYIGLEAAAVLVGMGKRVTVVEAQDRVLARVAGAELSEFYQSRHRAHGVEILLGVGVEAIEGDGTKTTGVRLQTGRVLPADMVIVGIGIVPNVGPLIEAGAEGRNGVDVDAFCATTLPDVFAIGDCAAHINRFAEGRRIRLESVQNANEQAAVAAKAIAGTPAPYDAVPWFWSNQYDLRLQTVGLSMGYDRTVLRGDLAGGSFTVAYLRGGKVIALDCVNNAKDYVQGKPLIMSEKQVDAAQLADPAIALKAL